MEMLFAHLLATFWSTVFPIIVVAVGGYLIKETVPILRAVSLRMGIAATVENDALISAVVTKWVRAAESIFEAQTQATMAPILNKGAQKLAYALRGIAADVPALPTDAARVHVEAALQELSLGPAKPVLLPATTIVAPASVVVNNNPVKEGTT